MRYLGHESEHPKRTRFYNYWTLLALSEADAPLSLEEIYRKVRSHLEAKKLLRPHDDLEYWIRWSVSNAQNRKGYAQNTAHGEWQITQKGRHWLDEPIDNDDIISDI